jgi:hypothetical protein
MFCFHSPTSRRGHHPRRISHSAQMEASNRHCSAVRQCNQGLRAKKFRHDNFCEVIYSKWPLAFSGLLNTIGNDRRCNLARFAPCSEPALQPVFRPVRMMAR